MNYGVSAEHLAKVSIDIKSPSGSSVWLGTVFAVGFADYYYSFLFLDGGPSS